MSYVRLATNEPDGSLLSETVTAKTYFIGLAMGSYDHDYRVVHSLLALLHGRRVSTRIWLVTIKHDVERVVSLLKSSLAEADGALMVEFPASMKLEDWTILPVFDAVQPLRLSTIARPRQAAGVNAQSLADAPMIRESRAFSRAG